MSIHVSRISEVAYKDTDLIDTQPRDMSLCRGVYIQPHCSPHHTHITHIHPVRLHALHLRINMSLKRSMTGLEGTSVGVTKKPRYQIPFATARMNQLTKWCVSEKLTIALIYFDGAAMVDITNPEKYGSSLALTPDQFRTVDAVKDAMTVGNFEYNIGGDIYLKREVYKTKWYVSIRQHYKDARGQVRPGKRGANMGEDVWKAFISIMNEIGKYNYKYTL